MPKLSDLASLIRSKNAGPFVLTFDVMFRCPEDYERVKRAKVLGPEIIARLYGVPVASVRFFECDNAISFKASIPRPVPQGDVADGDLHGGQQYVPLMELCVP
jgi:hypothetical protein